MRRKNALREHCVAPFVNASTPPQGDAWKPLANYISTITDSTDEEVETEGFYDGDGTPESRVTTIALAYDVEGFYNPADPAQQFIADMKLKTGDGRRCWHRVVSSDGTRTWIGHATVSSIVAGSGAATEDEEFSCTIAYNHIPVETITQAVPTP